MSTYQKIKDAQTEHVKSEAYVAVVVKPVQHLDTEAKRQQEDNIRHSCVQEVCKQASTSWTSLQWGQGEPSKYGRCAH